MSRVSRFKGSFQCVYLSSLARDDSIVEVRKNTFIVLTLGINREKLKENRFELRKLDKKEEGGVRDFEVPSRSRQGEKDYFVDDIESPTYLVETMESSPNSTTSPKPSKVKKRKSWLTRVAFFLFICCCATIATSFFHLSVLDQHHLTTSSQGRHPFAAQSPSSLTNKGSLYSRR